MNQQSTWSLPIGAQPDANGVHFRVWANDASHVEVVLYHDGYESGMVPLEPQAGGYFASYVPQVRPGARYMYRVDGRAPRPDPAARYQPDGVHGASQVIDPAAFVWADDGWRGRPLDDLVLYELHVGTATDAGTFDALIARLDDLRDLGVTAIELMPVADFPGERNWGYDGVSLFAPSRTYGGPDALRRLVEAAHARGLAVLLDVVYNHLGPDGNYLREFSRDYFTERHSTPWGDAFNLDGPNSAPVRAFFIANACYWAHEYHLDGLRLDATHALRDDSATHLLQEMAAAVRATLPAGRNFVLIAENEANDPTLVRPAAVEPAAGQQAEHTAGQPPEAAAGYGFDAVWADDFHHQVRVALTGEREGYYADYSGSAADLAATIRQGWFYIGQQPADGGAPRGQPTGGTQPPQFVFCIQNHDQVGNRALGERLSHQIGLDAYRAASLLLLLSPYTPLLFMGQEWAASTPFQYFTDHHEELGRLVTQGRRAEFARFVGFASETVPDPQARDTFVRSKLRWDERARAPHAGMLRLYYDALRLRAGLPALRQRSRDAFEVAPLAEAVLALRREGPAPGTTLLLVVNLRGARELALGDDRRTAAPGGQRWEIVLDSEDAVYGGRGAAPFDRQRQVLAFSGPGAVLLAAVGA